MKSFLFITCLLSTTGVFAAQRNKDLERQVLAALVKKAATVVLVDKVSGLDAKRQLSELIAAQLSYGYLQPDGDISLGGVVVTCKTSGSNEISVQYQCEVLFSVGAFEKKQNTFEGPSVDSSTSIEVPVSVAKIEGAKPVISDQSLTTYSAD